MIILEVVLSYIAMRLLRKDWKWLGLIPFGICFVWNLILFYNGVPEESLFKTKLDFIALGILIIAIIVMLIVSTITNLHIFRILFKKMAY